MPRISTHILDIAKGVVAVLWVPALVLPGVGADPNLTRQWLALACGLAVTVFSDLPSLRLFGWLSAFAMVAALFADLLILRPTIMFLLRFRRRKHQWTANSDSPERVYPP